MDKQNREGWGVIVGLFQVVVMLVALVGAFIAWILGEKAKLATRYEVRWACVGCGHRHQTLEGAAQCYVSNIADDPWMAAINKDGSLRGLTSGERQRFNRVKLKCLQEAVERYRVQRPTPHVDRRSVGAGRTALP